MQAESSTILKILDDQIHALQSQLAALGPMRPGTLTRQYRQPQKQKGPCYQLSESGVSKTRKRPKKPLFPHSAAQHSPALKHQNP